MLRIYGLALALAASVSANAQFEVMESLAKALTENRKSLDEFGFGEGDRSGMVTVKLGDTVVEVDGETYDGLVFKAPDNPEGKDFIWYFNAPEGWANWYILPLGEEPKQGFRDWLNADKVYAQFDKSSEKGRFRVLQTLDGSYFKGGGEYILWFRKVGDATPGELRLCAAFAKPEEKEKWDHEALEDALVLKPQPAEKQVEALGSLGGRILLEPEFFDRKYAEGRIDSLFFSLRRHQRLKGGFFIQIKTSTPPCRTKPKLADIIAKHGEPDFVRTSKEAGMLSESDDGDEEPTVTHYYDHFGFVVDEADPDQTVRLVEAQANDFSGLRPDGDERSTFGKLSYENLTVFHFDGSEVGRIYKFDEEGKEPLVITAPPEGAYRNGPVTLTYLGNGNWTMEGMYESGKKGYIKRYARNRLHGLTETFHESGKIKLSMPYKDGLLHGDVTELDEEGGVVRELVYRKGELQK